MDELIHHLFHRRHFWRHAKISELSELYISLMLRVLGISLIGVFIPVYLYQQGYSLSAITLYFALYHLARMVIDPYTGYLVSRYGPKHILRFSFFVEIFYLICVVAVGNNYAPLWMLLIFNAFAFSFFFVPFQVDFSTIKDAKKVGSQIGFIAIVQQIAGALGPLAGGLIASFYSFELAIFVALFITLLAGTPLMLSGEPAKKKEYRYRFKLTDYKSVLSYKQLPYVGHGVNMITANIIWPLFAAIAIFASQAYIGVGVVKAVSLAVGIVSAHVVGKIVDNHRGRSLMRVGVVLNSFSYYVRPFISTSIGAVAISIVAEPVYTASYIPLNKGYYDEIDSNKSGRVAQVVKTLATMHIARTLAWSVIFVASLYLSDIHALKLGLFVLGAMTLLMLTENFKALNK